MGVWCLGLVSSSVSSPSFRYIIQTGNGISSISPHGDFLFLLQGGELCLLTSLSGRGRRSAASQIRETSSLQQTVNQFSNSAGVCMDEQSSAVCFVLQKVSRTKLITQVLCVTGVLHFEQVNIKSILCSELRTVALPRTISGFSSRPTLSFPH